MPRTQTQTRLRSLYGQPETTDIPVLIGIERPPPDAYDKYLHLVPPHFCSTPALTNIDKVYTKYGNRYQKEKWRPLSIEAKGSAQRLYRKYGLAHNIRFRCGLYIVGSETDMQDTDRDRMMVLVFELSEQQLSLWTLLHTDAMKLLDQLKLSGEAGVCVRYYHRVEHSPIGDVVQGSQNTGPIADSYFDLRPGESFDSWMQRRDQFYEHRYGEQQRGRAQREVQSRTEDDHDANEPQVTMYGETGAPSSFMGTEARVSRIPTPLGLESPVNNTATVSAERSTTTRRPTTSGRSLHDHAHLAALTTHPTGGNSETMNTTMDSWNRIPNLLRQNAGVGSAEDRASFYEPDDATDVSVLSIAGSDKEEEALLPRIPEPALEYR